MKKINKILFHYDPPSIPFPSASEPKNLSLEDLNEKNRPLVSYRIHFITCRLIFQKIKKLTKNVPEKPEIYQTFLGTPSLAEDQTISVIFLGGLPLELEG